MWPTKKTSQPEHADIDDEDGKTKEDCDVERCLKLVMMDFNSSAHGSTENMKAEEENGIVYKKGNEKPKPAKKAVGQKHSKHIYSI